MFKDDDDDDEIVGAVRYPVMPSLVSLQQMRNRLHLAYLGRKLTKWTALATGKELRKLAIEMSSTFVTYAEDIRNAFMLLARARYFTPAMNCNVLENIPLSASVTIGASTKSIAGVKIMQFGIQEHPHDPYPHLGISKGGKAILDAKVAWRNLLKLMIIMMQQRMTFIQVEAANKNATKKRNVLSRVVIPRMLVTCRYIMWELEEMEREETFRLKRFKQLKYKLSSKAKEAKQGEPPVPRASPKPKKEKVKVQDDKPCRKKDEKGDYPKLIQDEKAIETILHTNMCACCMTPYDIQALSEKNLCPFCELEAKAQAANQAIKVNVVPCKDISSQESQNQERIENLMIRLSEVIDLAKSDGGRTASMEDFIKTATSVKKKLEGSISSIKIKSVLNAPCSVQLVPGRQPPSTPCSHTLSFPQSHPPLQPCQIVNAPCNISSSPAASKVSSQFAVCSHASSVPCSQLPSATSATSTPCSHVLSANSAPCSRIPSGTTAPCVRALSLAPCSRAASAPCSRVPLAMSSCLPSPPATRALSVPCSRAASFPCSQAPTSTTSRTPTATASYAHTAPPPCATTEPINRDTAPCGQPIEETSDAFKLTTVAEPRLGYFENKYKEIVKVSRIMKPDGTVCEEKRVITIRTERRNPGKIEDRDLQKYKSSFNSGNKYDEGCGGSGASGREASGGHGFICNNCCTAHNGGKGSEKVSYMEKESSCGTTGRRSHKCASHTTTGSNECKSQFYDDTDDEKLQKYEPTETKSEPTSKHCNSIGEPKVRSCMSADIHKCGAKEENKTEQSAKYQDKSCCTSQSACNERSEIESCFDESKNTISGAQTCWNRPNKTTTEKATSCTLNCGGAGITKQAEGQSDTESSQSTNQGCIRCISNKSTEQSPIHTTNSICSNRGSNDKSRSNNTGCTIKIITRQPTTCNDEDTEIVLRGSMLNVLQNLILPSAKCTQCRNTEKKNFCHRCSGKLSDPASRCSSATICHACQPKYEEGEEEFMTEYCSSCGTLGKFSNTSMSCKSAAAGSSRTGSSANVNSSCLNKGNNQSDSVFYDYRCATCSFLSRNPKSSCSSCPKANNEISCPHTQTHTRTRPDENEPTCRDAMTSTRRSDRFDCRPLSASRRVHPCEKNRSETCPCHSDSHILRYRNEIRPVVQQTQSCCDNNYYSKDVCDK